MLSVAKLSLLHSLTLPFLLLLHLLLWDDVLSLYWPCLNVSTFMRFTRWDRKWWVSEREMKWGWWWHYSWALFCSHSRHFLLCIHRLLAGAFFYARHATYLKCDWSCCGNDVFVALLVVDDDERERSKKINEKAALKSVTNFKCLFLKLLQSFF